MDGDGFLLPDDPVLDGTSTDFDSLTRDHQIAAANSTQLGGNYGIGTTLAGAAAFAPVDLADTISSSLGITQRGDVVNKALEGIGSPGLANFYNENKGAIEVGSGIAGIVAADYGARKFLEPAGFAMRALSKVPFAGRIATLDAEYQQASRAVQVVDQMSARRGVMGVEQYVGDINLTSLGVPAVTVNRESVARGFRWAAIKQGLARNVATEAIMATTLHTNSMLYGDNMGENLLWMGAGLGLGAFIDRTAAIYSMRKFVNSDIVTRKFAKAYDPTGVEADRLKSYIGDIDPNASLSHLGYLQGYLTDRATSFMVSARSLANRDLTGMKDLAGRRERFGTQDIGLARDEMQKVTTRGVNGVQGSNFSLSTPGLGNHVDMRLMEDPSSFYGVESLGAARPGQSLSSIHETRGSQLDARQTYVRQVLTDGGVWRNRVVTEDGQRVKKQVLVPLADEKLQPFRDEYKQLVFHQSLTPMVSTGREWVPMTIGKLIDDFVPPKITTEVSDELKLFKVDDPDLKIAVGNDGSLITPKNKAPHELDLYDSLRLFQSGAAAIDDMAASRTVLNLPRNPNWFQLDMAESLIKKTKDESLVQFPAGMTRQTAQMESFSQKVKALSKSKVLTDKDAMAKARMQFNLPALSSYESGLLGTTEHPIDVLLRSTKPEQLKELTYADVLKGMQEVRKINGLTEMAKDKTDSIAGEMFSFLRDNTGKPIQPILAYKRPFAPFEWSKEDLAQRVAMRKAYVRQGLSSGDDFTRAVTDTMVNDPDYFTASQTAGLMDNQIQSFMPGFATAAPQTARGGALNSVVSREWRDRDNPILLAAARIRDKGERLVRAVMREKVEGFLGDVHSRLNGPRNMQSRLLANQFLTYRPGWDLVEAPVETALPNGQKAYGFALDQKSEANAKRWKATYGTDMPEDAVLRSPQGKEIVLDDLGMEFKERFNNASTDIVNSKNTLLKSQGLGEIGIQNHYAPPPNTKGKYIGFTLDLERKPVPGGTIIAATPEEFGKLKLAMERDTNSPLNREGNIFYTQDEIKDFADIWDRAHMDFIDPGTTAIQPGKRGTGALTGMQINPNAVEDALTWLRDSYLRHGDDVMKLLTKEQVNAAQTRAQVARVTGKNLSGSEDGGRSIYDHYIDSLTGRAGIASPGSQVGKFYRGAEDWTNRILRETSPHVSAVWRGMKEYIDNVIPGLKSKGQDAVFNKLAEQLGPHMPFDNVSQMVERQFGAKRPPELAQITGKMSYFEATMRLRILETMQPIMNLSGIINAIPSVVRHAQPLAEETAEQYAARIGHSTQLFNLPDGNRLGIMDTAKLAYRGFMRAWNRGSEADYAHMLSHGYITQEVAEFQRQFGAVDSKSNWRKFMTGDPTSPNAYAKKGLVGWASVLSDKSEDFSRSWGHMVGLDLAESLGIQGREAQHTFAHDLANKMIANYDPKNRPEIFQGALGAPIGLFQSFIWNYYQRLFRYIETKDARSFATQYAMQGSLYGVTTLPGWDSVNKLFFDHSDGEHSPYDAIYKRFGQSTGDVLMGGVLSNLPKLANVLPGVSGVPGLDLYSRGDTNVRMPVVNAPPFVDSARRIWNAIGDGAYMFSKNNPHLTGQEIAEVLSNTITNRPIAGFIEQAFAGGYDTDKKGQVAAQAHDLMDATYRILGVRSMQQSHELSAFYSNKNAMELQHAKMEELDQSVRAALRSGDTDSIPNYFNTYVQNGGDPRRFRQWVKTNFTAAMETRGARQLESLSRHPEKWNMTQRLLDAQVTVDKGHLNPDAYRVQPIEQTDTNPDMPANLTDPLLIEHGVQQLMTDPSAGSAL